MKKIVGSIALGLLCVSMMGANGCEDSDDVQRRQQEVILAEGTAQVGMPAIKNFRERKLLKDILELRDQNGLITYTYLYNEMTGKLVYFGQTVGYGIPYSTQFSNPMKASNSNGYALPQADPNGLFSPASSEGTWVLLKNPNGDDVKPVYIEPRIVVSPFRLKTE